VAPPKSEDEKEAAEAAKSKREMAKEWLRDFLADGPKPVKECHQEAAKDGITKGTLERAAREVCGKPRKIDGAWVWRLQQACGDGEQGASG
jgi:hypothetical protein